MKNFYYILLILSSIYIITRKNNNKHTDYDHIAENNYIKNNCDNAYPIYKNEIDSAKKLIIKYCERFNDKYIIDSIKNINIYLGSCPTYIGGAHYNNIILINKENKEFFNNILHELAHHVDMLTKSSKLKYQNIKNLVTDSINDYKTFNDYVLLKYTSKENAYKFKIKSKKSYKDFKELTYELYKDYKYSTSPSEIFVRSVHFRCILYSNKIIKNINDDVSEVGFNKSYEYHKSFKRLYTKYQSLYVFTIFIKKDYKLFNKI